MFATRKQLASLEKELQQMRLVVARLRQDLTRAQGQLRNMDGWGDDFIKTREVTDANTRLFLRHEADPSLSALPQWIDSGDSKSGVGPPRDNQPSDLDPEALPDSAVRRRIDPKTGLHPAATRKQG